MIYSTGSIISYLNAQHVYLYIAFFFVVFSYVVDFSVCFEGSVICFLSRQ